MATLKDLIAVTEASVLQQPAAAQPADVPIAHSRTDSRQVMPGDVYWAIRSASGDAAHHCDEAFSRGAVAVVTAQPLAVPPEHWVLQTADDQQALQRWALWRRQHFSGTLIVVAGGTGRTTARKMIHLVLGTRLRGIADTVGRDARLGVAAAISALEPAHDYAVLELPTTSSSAVAAFRWLAMPKALVLTPPAHASVAYPADQQGIPSAYKELLAALPSDGRAVLADDPWLRWIATDCPAPITWVGTSDACDLKAENVQAANGGVCFKLGKASFGIPARGQHHLTAALCAAAVGRMMGMDFHDIAAELEQYRPIPQRCELVETRGATFISDPCSSDWLDVSQLLAILRDVDAPGRRILVCGDLATPDPRPPARYWQLGRDAVQTAGVHLLIACGRYAKHVTAGARAAGMPPAKAIACRTPAEAMPYLGQATQPGDVVLVIGAGLLEPQSLAEKLGAYPLRRTA